MYFPSSVTGLGYSNQYNGGYTLLLIVMVVVNHKLYTFIHKWYKSYMTQLVFKCCSCFGVCDGKLYWFLNVGPGSVPPFTYIWRDDEIL